jgi:hypothetical protein
MPPSLRRCLDHEDDGNGSEREEQQRPVRCFFKKIKKDLVDAVDKINLNLWRIQWLWIVGASGPVLLSHILLSFYPAVQDQSYWWSRTTIPPYTSYVYTATTVQRYTREKYILIYIINSSILLTYC